MKNRFALYTALIFSLLVSSACTVQSREIFTLASQKQVSALHSLLAELQVPNDGSLNSIVAVTQQQWLRAKGKERWEVDELEVANKQKVLSLLRDLGFVSEVKPAKTSYDYAILLGATSQRMEYRMSYLIHLWNSGVRFKQLVILVGQRPRDPDIEAREVLQSTAYMPVKKGWKLDDGNLPATETEMAQMILDKAELPEGFRKAVKVVVVDTPAQQEDGKIRRPNTKDTVIEWLRHEPVPGTVLSVSNNPYIPYQDAVLKTYLPTAFVVETVGWEADQYEKISVFLDTVARWLYQEKERRDIQQLRWA